ncbi:PA2779 family protein [Pelagibius marinus]|uniref:PA2779 family protein n=1 Tax=Pelagibius marinus TaxID=2762760 RepID=UPI001872E715|nr:PA2779 family protein [Pelagibius marinus]
MKHLIIVLLVTALGFQSLVAVPAQAAMISTGDVVAGDSSLASDRDRLNALMQREDVRAEIRRQGVDPDEAAARVAALSDAEVAQLTSQIDQLPAGQNAIGVIVGAIVLIFLVLLVTDLLCLTSVFNFTRCAN